MDFSEWLKTSAGLLVGLLPINMSIVRGSAQFGAEGPVQAGIAIVTGLGLGIGTQIAVFGQPSDFAGWFFAGLFGIMLAGASIGTYEVIKTAAAKGVNGQ